MSRLVALDSPLPHPCHHLAVQQASSENKQSGRPQAGSSQAELSSAVMCLTEQKLCNTQAFSSSIKDGSEMAQQNPAGMSSEACAALGWKFHLQCWLTSQCLAVDSGFKIASAAAVPAFCLLAQPCFLPQLAMS